ncbi:MAG: polysaccharide biosynthesis tyrosine autokinase [Alphaproteobacteria bacterium]
MTTSTELNLMPQGQVGLNRIARQVQGFEFAAFVRLFNRRKNVIAGLTMLTTLFMILMAFILPPRYLGTAIVMQDMRKAHVSNVEEVLSGLTTDSGTIRSEMEILRSRTMIGRVVDKLDLMNDPHINRKAGNSWFSPGNWFSFLHSPRPPGEEKAALRTAVINEIERRLDINNDGRSFAIRLAFSGNTPQQAALIANTFVELYLVDQLETKYEAAERANKWLGERLQALREKVESSEAAVADYRRKNNLTEFNGTTITTQQASQINTQLVEARAIRAQAEARLRGTQDMVRQHGSVEASGDVLSSQLIQKLREQESEVRRALSEMTNRYGERHPLIINKKEELRGLMGKIGEEVSKIVKGLANEVEIAKAKETSLEGELKRIEARADLGNTALVTLNQLERESQSNKTLYEGFLTRFKQVNEQQGIQDTDSRIVARAEAPLETSFPNKPLFVLLGIVGGFALGMVAAFLIEYFDRGFRGMPQIEEYLGLTALGMVPSLKGATDKTPEDYIVEKPLSSYSESLRTIRTGIHFSNVDHPPKIVMFTSALPSEGKSTVVMSLARSLALTGNKVIIIEGDLRRPRIRKALGGNPKMGDITHVLGGEKPFNEVVQKDRASGLDYLPAGKKAPNPQDLLGSQQMEKLLRFCAAHYDLVLVDTPPVLAVSDAAMIARVADCSIFVVRWGSTPRDVSAQAVKMLSGYTNRIAGAILSQVDLESHVKYGYGDIGYYYGHYREYYHN